MIVIVVGMHRSGTSAVAGLLHLNGISMGKMRDFKPKPLPQNPKGFYENYVFRKISDSVLEYSKYDVKSYNPILNEIRLPIRIKTKMMKVVEEYNSKFENWGWKDPRTCLTLEVWLEVISEMNLFEQVKILFTIRNEYSVAKSLYSRNHLPLDQSVKLWKTYNECAINTIDQFGAETHYFTYEQLIGNPIKITDSIFSFLDHKFDKKTVMSFVDIKLNRSEKDFTSNERDSTIPGLSAFKEKLYSRISI